MTDEMELREDDVRNEHLDQVNVGLHWLYMFGVLGVAIVLMLIFMAYLGGSS